MTHAVYFGISIGRASLLMNIIQTLYPLNAAHPIIVALLRKYIWFSLLVYGCFCRVMLMLSLGREVVEIASSL